MWSVDISLAFLSKKPVCKQKEKENLNGLSRYTLSEAVLLGKSLNHYNPYYAKIIICLVTFDKY